MSRYTPDPALADTDTYDDLQRLASLLRNFDTESVTLALRNAAPAKHSTGMIVYADGTNWNPDGSGRRGIYARHSGAWNFLG